MVDVTSSEHMDRRRIERPAANIAKPGQSELAAVVFATDEVSAAYQGLSADAIHAPAQSVGWIQAWSKEVNKDIVLVTAQHRGTTVFALPLEIVQSGPLRIARFAGGSHANGNFCPASPSFLNTADAADIRSLIEALHRSRPDIDLVSLDRQLETHGGFDNPMLLLGKSPCPNIALAVDLEGGFDVLLARASGKRKRKKNRSQIRKFEQAGGYQIVEAASVDEIDRLLTAYFDMKACQFKQMGVTDVFAQKEIQAFFRALCRNSLESSNSRFVVNGLEVGGKLRAVTGSSIEKHRIVCDFAAFADDDLAQASPGEFLFFHNINSACEAGFKLFDFSVGDERYKRLWCPTETQQYETLIPLTAKGHVLAAGLRLRNRLERAIKSSVRVRTLARKMRARFGRAT